jgi:hypothetical protein
MFDNQEHYHASDRFPSRDTLLWLNSLEKVKNVNADYTVSNNDDYLIVDTSTGDVDITLPSVINGRKLYVYATGANIVNILPDGTDLINDVNGVYPLTEKTLVTLKAYPSGWLVMGSDRGLFWDDLRFPSQGINPAGASAPPTVSNATGMLEFAGNTDNTIAGIAQMPHAWANGTEIHPHIHLRFINASANNTRWKFEYDIANVFGDFVNAYGTYTTLSTVTKVNPNNAKKHELVAFGPIDMTGFNDSCCIMWKISRLASSDALDNDTGACALLEFDIHYQSNARGSRTEYSDV